LRRNVISLGLVWLTAFNLRVILFAIPPSLPAIHSDLGLSYSATGTITSLAILVLGAASIPGALLATRYGARRLVAICVAGLGVFTVSLTLPPAVFWVFAGSALLRRFCGSGCGQPCWDHKAGAPPGGVPQMRSASDWPSRW